MLGRFVSRDPYAGRVSDPLTLNRYTYVENNPVNKTDPSGLASSKVLEEIPFDLSSSSTANASAALMTCEDVILPANIPPGVDLRANIALAAQHKRDTEWFISMVDTGNPWDYKQGGNNQYEDFGNFHYGLVGKASGYPLFVLLYAAGRNQQDTNKARIAAGDEPIVTGPPYGDAVNDPPWITLGNFYYNCIK